MTTSTPPAWAWLDVPIAYPANALSIHSRKVPDSATLREQNDSPGCDVSCSPDISCDRKHDATGCDEAAKVTDAQSNAVETYVFPEIGQFPGQKTGSEEETHEDLQGKDADKMADTFDVPFSAQQWMFESLCEVEIENLHDLIDDHHDMIIEMARDRFRKGFCKYGSTMYSWSPERRLNETLQELADAVVYPTSGSIE